jgi:hypothetical protein
VFVLCGTLLFLSASIAPSLFPSRIQRLSSIEELDQVPVPCSSRVVFVLDSLGRRWVQKDVTAFGLLGESLGWRLSGLLNVPTPEAGVASSRNDRWLLRAIEPAQAWNLTRAQNLRSSDTLGAIIGFDAIIGNEERHAENILFTPVPGPGSLLDVFSIDLEASWLGSPNILRVKDVDVPGLGVLIEDIPYDLVRDGARALASRAETIDQEQLADAVREACQVSLVDDGEAILRCVLRRCHSAGNIVGQYLAQLESRAK